MTTTRACEIKRVWRPPGGGLELHRGVAGPTAWPRHSHEDFQIGVLLGGAARFGYRGSGHVAPPGSLSLLEPGEVHTGHAVEEADWTFRTAYLAPALLQNAAAVVAGRGEGHLPYFPQPVVVDAAVVGLFLELHAALEGPASGLERDTFLLCTLTLLVRRHAESGTAPRPARRERAAVRRVREYLEENYAENVSLDRLSAVARLSSFHLVRVFAAEVGLPPHAYQTQVRVNRARRLLSGGTSVVEAALATGFADQSHLTRLFKRLVGVTPGRFAGRGPPAGEG